MHHLLTSSQRSMYPKSQHRLAWGSICWLYHQQMRILVISIFILQVCQTKKQRKRSWWTLESKTKWVKSQPIHNISNTFSETSFDFVIAFITQHLLLLSRTTEFYLFMIPEREPLRDSGDAFVVPVHPIWTYQHLVEPIHGCPYMTPPAEVSNGYPCGKVVILTGKYVYLLSLSDNRDDCHIHHYMSSEPGAQYVPYRASIGSRHAIWTLQRPAAEFVGLQTCAYFTSPEGCDSGKQRLGHVGDSGTRFRPLRLPVRSGDVLDISWDEDSGRLCAYIGPGWRNEMSRILIVDLA